MIVVGIIAIMLASAVMSVASGRGAVQIKEATRGVIQLSRYASALALLRQRPAVITFFHDGKIEVRLSGESSAGEQGGKQSAPIYREVDVNGRMVSVAEEAADEDSADGDGDAREAEKESEKKERNGLFFTRRVLDPDALAKEDKEGEFDGVTFTVEVLGEDGEPLDRDLAASRSLRRPKREKRNADGEIEEEADGESGEPPVSVTYDTNGNVNPHRITVRQKDASAADEGFVISVSRSGRATVGDEEEGGGNVRRRRR